MKNILALRRHILAAYRISMLRLRLSKIKVGKNFYCNKGFFVERQSLLTAGDNVYIGRHTHIGSDVELGNDIMIASYVAFVGGDHKIDDIGTTAIRNSGREHNKKTIVEDNVWIGHGCIIMAGVTIKSGAVIAAGSVVTKDVENDVIVGSNPAKLIRKRRI